MPEEEKKESNPCEKKECSDALKQFYTDRKDFRDKKADHDNECGELKASRNRLKDFLIGLGVVLGAYVGSAITIALNSLAAGAGAAAALTAIGGTLTGLATSLQSIPFIGQVLGAAAAAALVTLGILTGLYLKDLYDESQTRKACLSSLKKANESHAEASKKCPAGKNCVPNFTGNCNCK